MRILTKKIFPQQEQISIEVQPEALDLANWIIGYFESKIQSGTRFQNGQTVELGWSILLLRKIDDTLELYEPDFDGVPIRWCRGVNNTVRHLFLQRAICSLLDCEPLFPTMRHAGVASLDFYESGSFTMSRDNPGESDSGWVFTESGYFGSQGNFVSLYQLALFKIEIVPFLALPPSSLVVIEPGLRTISFNSITKSSKDCELLQSLIVAKILV